MYVKFRLALTVASTLCETIKSSKTLTYDIFVLQSVILRHNGSESPDCFQYVA